MKFSENAWIIGKRDEDYLHLPEQADGLPKTEENVYRVVETKSPVNGGKYHTSGMRQYVLRRWFLFLDNDRNVGHWQCAGGI